MRCLCGAEMEPVEKGRWAGWGAVPGYGSWKRHWCTQGHAVRGNLSEAGERIYEVVRGHRITAYPIGFNLVVWDEEAL
jgi:hypothetical protein